MNFYLQVSANVVRKCLGNFWINCTHQDHVTCSSTPPLLSVNYQCFHTETLTEIKPHCIWKNFYLVRLSSFSHKLVRVYLMQLVAISKYSLRAVELHKING